ncbi:MAG: putative PKHD-type hydroxylase-like protein [Hyperionvirus sp.]|uniref:Putative PKHD-type hydroxylase-like protein n=1 Tax=Hyperionvirus sp. TaxID=2487770 RepID=A0A3G5A6M4_9VIRU|nr:MAG: putative PKHD-type hydroxylase-like protein [Hyperionvirus sp.]
MARTAMDLILGTVSKDHQLARKQGVLVFPASTWLVGEGPDADAKQISKWLELSEKAKTNRQVNNMHKFTGDIAMTTAEVKELIQRSWPFVREFYKLFDYKDPYLYAGFMIKYAGGKDSHLDLHTDDCLFTINICLQSSVSGTDIVFEKWGVGGTKYCSVEMKSGDFLFHLGDHAHQTSHLRSGERTNLVLWINAHKIKDVEEKLELKDRDI